MCPQVQILHAGEQQSLNVIGDAVTPLITSAQSAGVFEQFDLQGPEESGPPPHHHPWDEAYYVIEGVIDVMIEGKTTRLEVGASALIPRGVVHAYRIASPHARMLVTTSPGGAGLFFADMHAHVRMPPDIPTVIAVATRNQVIVTAAPQ